MLVHQAIEQTQWHVQTAAHCLTYGIVFQHRHALEPADFRPKLRIADRRGRAILPRRVWPVQTDRATAAPEPAIIEFMFHKQAHQYFRARDIRSVEHDAR
jgi:hypothetical protein